MTRRTGEMEATLLAELDRWEGYDWRIERGGKHWKIVLEADDRSFMMPYSAHAKGRAIKNNVARLRRALADLGARSCH